MKIALDIDGVITEYPEFFKLLSAQPGSEVHILTNRDPDSLVGVERWLASAGIRYDLIALTPHKAEYIIKHGINVFFENTDEYFQGLPPSVCVCKVREPGNFNYRTHRWIYDNKTGEHLYSDSLDEKLSGETV